MVEQYAKEYAEERAKESALRFFQNGGRKQCCLI